MPLFSNASSFDDDVEKATAANNTTEDWHKIMEICDQIPRATSGPKDALKSIMKRVNQPIPQVSLQALTLLDACVNNCGKVFHLEVCSRDFVGEVRNSLARIHPAVALKFRGMVRDWAKTFKDDPQLNLIPTLYEELKREKQEFPEESSITLSDVMSQAAFLWQVTKENWFGIPLVTSHPTTSATSSSKPATTKTTTSNEDDDLALAIQLSIQESEGSKAKTSSLYPSVSSSLSSSSSSNKSRKVRALYDFEAAEDNELTFKTGDIITVTDNSDANWWKGELNGKAGLFPANFATFDLTPDPQPVKKKGKKKKKKVSFSAKNSVKEFEASKAISQPVVISEEKIAQCLEMLKNCNVDDEEDDENNVSELEESCKKMFPLITEKINEIEKKHIKFSELNDSYVLAMSTYQRLASEPLPVPKSYSTPGNPSKYAAYSTPMTTPPVQQPYAYGQYAAPVHAPQYPSSASIAPEAMGSVYSTQAPPGHIAYATPQSQYVPQLQQTAPYQAASATPQEYGYTVGHAPSQYQPEVQYPSQQQQPQQQFHYPTQANYPAVVSAPYAADTHPQLIAAQNRY